MTEALTPERILAATEDVLRRYGPTKATVVDVARALGVSHGSVYRHFRTKTALREAVTKRWIDHTTVLLEPLAAGPGPADRRLADWLTVLFHAKRRKAMDDPELFATYTVLAEELSEVVAAHVADLVGQLTRIIEDGRAADVFAPGPPESAVLARAVHQATAMFHKPHFAARWALPEAEADFTALRDLVVRGCQ
ncbi:TetR family transcriptional regulator [Streptomyces hainanensis]|uniref:TetR/AcrR family transcriptional regulator n=1 Tax=Streptomyces hainanensis TaxID=402648 RepID=A0A4V2Y1J4_9ACTN|nr:TetR family transcriptional regulator [Streptomyces hainanensis]TDC68975.1 TetR/AcrR family transcriptional regulator [Streptomyces hainanensis]